jgi:GntR family transcriptional regulator, trigonelline degradation regulator
VKPFSLTVQPVLVRDSAVRMLRNAIITGEIKSGTRLIERELCEALGVSRGSVREVIRQLEAERLITVEPRKGPIVASLSAKQISDIYDIRMMLEAHVAQCFAKTATPAQIKALGEIYERLRKAIRAHDRINVLILIGDFTDYMTEVVDNEAIRDTLQVLNARIASLRATAIEAPGRLDASRVELDDLFNAIVARKPKMAMKAMETYVRAARDAALTRVASSETRAAAPGKSWTAPFPKTATR